ncbi:hypothetical protein HUN01_21350 [Nostoc edaphicum CCNP1411]|uniref:Uncharacterized protein n=1 Tax=Nostoc edaphicum CCNP1411 TaxID=1472755 RepID=A0A7D7LGC5_9NOSO|nr:hypothetical protein HUN01_21350 [Nostoc edaphicum CCNP1411]
MITTAITTAFAVVAGIVNHIMSGNRERENQQTTASLKYTEQQLEELYGPLAFLIWEGRRTYTDLVEKLTEMRGKKHISGSLKVVEKDDRIIFPLRDEEEIKLWVFWIEKDAFPRHEKIKKLLMSKTHLIKGEIMPNSYLNFLDYHNSWKMEHLRWQEQQIKYPWKSKFNFPLKFETDIIETFTDLKGQQANFLKVNKNSAKIVKKLNSSNR